MIVEKLSSIQGTLLISEQEKEAVASELESLKKQVLIGLLLLHSLLSLVAITHLMVTTADGVGMCWFVML